MLSGRRKAGGNVLAALLGTGCAKCKKVEEIVKQAVLETKAEAQLFKVEDIQEILKYKVLSTPAVAIDGEVKVAGRIPSIEEIKTFLV